MESIRAELQDVFRNVFGDDDIVIADSTTAHEIDGWDSMMHINLIIAVQKRFGVKFAAAEIGGLTSEGQNVGGLIHLLERKMADSKARRP
jgi:acyl carrier protein